MLDVRAVINERMDWLGISAKELADLTGYSKTCIHNLRAGRSSGWLTTVDDLLNALGLELVVREKDERPE